MIMYLLPVFTIVIVTTSALALRLNRSFEKVLPTFFFSIILIAYVMAICNVLAGLNRVMLAILTMVIIYIVYRFISHEAHRKSSMRLLITSGSLLFIALSSILILHNCGRMFSAWDEFTHWGLSAKNMFALDSFAIGSKANTIFQDYPPAMSLLQYFFNLYDKVFMEAYVILANAIFSISLLIAMFPVRRKTNWMASPLFIGLCGLAVLVFFPNHFEQVYVDGILGILFAFLAIRAFDTEPWDSWRIAEFAMGCAVLTLVKASGFFLALLSAALLLANPEMRKLKRIGIPFLSVLFAKLTWSMIVAGLDKHFDIASIPIKDITTFLAGNAPAYRYETIRNFFAMFTQKPMILFDQEINILGFPISYCIYALFVFALIGLLSHKLNRPIKRRNTILLVFLLIGCIGYVTSLLFMYLFTFSPYEAVRLASYTRYLGTFFLALTLILFYRIADVYARSIHVCLAGIFKRKAIALLVLVLVLSASIFIYPKAKTFLISWRFTQTIRAPYTQIEKYQSLFTPEDKIYLIAQHTNGYAFWILRYNLTPIRTQNIYGSWSLGGPYDATDVWYRDITPQAFKEELIAGYAYVYIYKYDERFIAQYGALFANVDDIKNQTLFRVDRQGTNAILYLVTQ
jgi:hypothetical protein